MKIVNLIMIFMENEWSESPDHLIANILKCKQNFCAYMNSIPSGSIKRKGTLFGAYNAVTFQFHLVRLKVEPRLLYLSDEVISILLGAIKSTGGSTGINTTV